MINKKGYIIFNNKNSQDLGIIIEEVPNMSRPSRKYQSYSVPGRSGDIIEQYDAYENIERSYNVWFTDYFYNSLYAPAKAREVAAWLYSSQGYMRLEDNFEPDYFRLAYFVGPLDIESVLLKYGRCTITFICRPERYAKTGETWLNNPTLITNPYSFASKPLIKIEGSGNCSLTIENFSVSFTDINSYIYIDCDAQDCYKTLAENENSKMTGAFPVLKSGTNRIELSSMSLMTLKIQPRFWTL